MVFKPVFLELNEFVTDDILPTRKHCCNVIVRPNSNSLPGIFFCALMSLILVGLEYSMKTVRFHLASNCLMRSGLLWSTPA